uniref:SRCR domain-containing protein n=1 Tax=Callorhinchus milii TaxID=7868 RepID=A0A4W3GCS2_CALMI
MYLIIASAFKSLLPDNHTSLKYHSLKLIGGNNNCSGTVKLKRDYKSGSICDYYWDMKDADVLCRQLDCGFALSTGLGAHFGKETGRIWKTNFNCVGNESLLWDCPWSFWEEFSCTHVHDVTVLSHVFMEKFLIETVAGTEWHLRLESGGSRCDGRVEIYHDGTWGRLLDDSWNISDGDVICRQLNCGSAISVYNSSQYGEGTGPVWINNVQCAGTETHIWNCPHSTVASSSGTSRDVGVLCSGECHFKLVHVIPWNKLSSFSAEDFQIRLMDGGSSCAGRVEIYYNGSWGTVCDDSWGSLEANVVCKQLGCGSAVKTTSAAVCARASAPVWLDDVRCTGKESALWECPSSPWGQHDCYHKEDVSIVSIPGKHKMLRLANGQHSCEGRVEVFYNGTWGTVCSDSMGMDEAEVICKQLDCGKALDVEYDGKFDEGSGPIWLDDMECNSKESFLWQCSSRPWGRCGVRTAGLAARPCGLWGQAGLGQGAGQIWLDELHCRGSESFLWDCVSASAGRSDCVHKEDAGVVCSGRDPISQCSSTNLRFFKLFSTKAD